MPTVKKSAGRSKASRARRSPRRPVRQPGLFARLVETFENYTLASVAGAFVILATGVAILWVGGYFGVAAKAVDREVAAATRAAGFQVERVTIRGTRQTAYDDVLAAIGPVIGSSVLCLDLSDVRARVEALGWVKTASVTRLLPAGLHISIRERTPAAIWQIDRQPLLIDAEGAVIREVGTLEYSYLPLIVGAGAPEAAAEVLQALARFPVLAERTSALIRVSERRWTLELRNKAKINLPESGLAEAIEMVGVLQTAHGTLDQDIEYIDLRDSERMIIKRRGEPPSDVGGGA